MFFSSSITHEGIGYHLPNDEKEAERLDLQHKIWTLVLRNKLYRAPLDAGKLRNALDVGTGTGIWAIEFADEHPDCHIIGTDLSPIQPSWLPPNCEFMVDDLESDQEWIYPPMDFIHSRLIVSSVRRWPRYLQRCYDALAPGGWIELVEVELPLHCDDGSAEEDDPVMKWGQGLYDAGQIYGADFLIQNKLKGLLAEAGFIDVTREDYQWPIGPYSNDPYLAEIGAYMIPNAYDMMDATKKMFSGVLGWSAAEVEVFNAKFRASVKNSNAHRYFSATVHYARKPDLPPHAIPVSLPIPESEPANETKKSETINIIPPGATGTSEKVSAGASETPTATTSTTELPAPPAKTSTTEASVPAAVAKTEEQPTGTTQP